MIHEARRKNTFRRQFGKVFICEYWSYKCLVAIRKLISTHYNTARGITDIFVLGSSTNKKFLHKALKTDDDKTDGSGLIVLNKQKYFSEFYCLVLGSLFCKTNVSIYNNLCHFVFGENSNNSEYFSYLTIYWQNQPYNCLTIILLLYSILIYCWYLYIPVYISLSRRVPNNAFQFSANYLKTWQI